MNRKPKRPRVVLPKNGTFSYQVFGAPVRPLSDMYYFLLSAGWWRLMVLAFLSYIVINVLFAVLYMLGGECIENAEPGSFSDAFWFSIQTFSTIGYGSMSPITLYAHVLVTLESFAGLIGVAVGTGLIFAKFARPSARVGFSDNMVVHRRNGIPCLSFRIANERVSSIVDAHLSVNVLLEEVSAEGHSMRRFYPLKLERAALPMFQLSWTAIHKLTDESPLVGLERGESRRMLALVAAFQGLDDVFMQVVHAQKFYKPDDILIGHSFADMLEHHGNEVFMFHDRLSDVKAESAQDAEVEEGELL
ncbi:MAG: ion channel [Myxococcota bacterium]